MTETVAQPLPIALSAHLNRSVQPEAVVYPAEGQSGPTFLRLELGGLSVYFSCYGLECAETAERIAVELFVGAAKLRQRVAQQQAEAALEQVR